MTERWQAWRVTLTMIYEDPLGVGAGNWWLTLPKYGQNLDYKFFTNNIFRHPHCDYLWVLSEVGVIGFIGYIGMFFTSLYYAFKTKRTYLVAGLVGYMAIMLFSFPNERAFSSMVLMLFMALAVKGYHVKPCTKRVKDAYFKYTSDMRVFRMTGVNIILLLVFMLVVLGYRHKALIYNSRLRSTTWDNVVKETNGYSMFSSVTFTGVPFHWFRGLAYLQQKNYVDGIISLNQALKHSPYNIHVLNTLGANYMILGQKEKAMIFYERALKIYPDYKDAQKNVAFARKLK